MLLILVKQFPKKWTCNFCKVQKIDHIIVERVNGNCIPLFLNLVFLLKCTFFVSEENPAAMMHNGTKNPLVSQQILFFGLLGLWTTFLR